MANRRFSKPRDGIHRTAAPASGGPSRRAAAQSAVGALLAGLLAACSVGPRFVPPPAPGAVNYMPAGATLRLTAGSGEPAQNLAAGERVPADWWELFHSPVLDDVVRRAIAGSPTIEAAQATLAEAQQTVLEVRGGYYPQLDLGAAAFRQKGPAFALGLLPARSGLPIFNLYTLGPTLSFSPDVFGLTGRRLERQQALAQLEVCRLAAAQLGVTGNAVTQALSIGALRLQLGAAAEIAAEDEQNVELVERKFAAGKAPRMDLLTARTQLANDRSLLPVLGQQLAAAEDALAVLVGKAPGEWQPPSFELGEFTLPAQLPLVLPSALVRRRPDILAAEAQLHADSAAIGVATAELYPNIDLSASLDAASLTTGALFDRNTAVWSLGGGLTAPIFHGGALRAQRRAALEGYRASLALYRETVLQAFGQVSDTLRALGHDAELVEDSHGALDAAREALDLQRIGYAAGKSDVLRLIDAERSYQQARLGYARATAQRYVDSAQLLVALGGGWWQDGGDEVRGEGAQ